MVDHEIYLICQAIVVLFYFIKCLEYHYLKCANIDLFHGHKPVEGFFYLQSSGFVFICYFLTFKFFVNIKNVFEEYNSSHIHKSNFF